MKLTKIRLRNREHLTVSASKEEMKLLPSFMDGLFTVLNAENKKRAEQNIKIKTLGTRKRVKAATNLGQGRQ